MSEKLNWRKQCRNERHFAVALENIFQGHNSNAVVRTCDCFGIQDCHVIETINKFSSSVGVSKGAIK